MVCTRRCTCGQLMPPDDYICPKCGSRVGLGPVVYFAPDKEIDDWDKYEAAKKKRQWKTFLIIFTIAAIALGVILFITNSIQHTGWFLLNLFCYEISFLMIIFAMRWMSKKGEKNEFDFDKYFQGSMVLGSIIYLIVWVVFLIGFFVDYSGKKDIETLLDNARPFFLLFLPVISYILGLIIYYPVLLYYKVKEWLFG